MVEPRFLSERRQLFTDGDLHIRRGALAAALEAPDPGDVPALLEAARLDPDPLSRSLAARAATASGTTASVLELRDLYRAATPEDRLAFIEAFSQASAVDNGGASELLWVVETQSGHEKVSAAGALFRSAQTEEARGQAAGALEAVIAGSGTTEERRLAIRLTFGNTPEFEKAFEVATKDADSEVQTLAWARLSYYPKYQKKARTALRDIFEHKPTARHQARQVLAELGDDSVKESLVEDLKAQSRTQRRVAALGLVRLGEYSDAATALGDADPNVRVATACAIVAEDSKPRSKPRRADNVSGESNISNFPPNSVVRAPAILEPRG
jgi:HEAT repeat protein